jgi:diadenosine tetraphosphate (Ap4A) HIT family hydrolase
MKVFESDKVFAFLDIAPLSKGHTVRPRPYTHTSVIHPL